ncbi:molybdate ABC transporter substrate-binding protein [Sphingomonas desiccabilis]|uniref:Molybdate ABC transporter substrate-binding protein n=1 Tax=Sphingomonas desiccabilis TaxID=429134 RepID=A0A4Q2IUK1_9SPHN|nr:molybdate ABC transporter substrate-binding protein [Sphingomonas desiccabilis]MBB3911331.1 molybdate transport system substrate-binding protein [Sphingomonas desiccabilis]RXZ31879.1 molybdate ABC transporter substrate-binding protein [Sphingomonas desiccabilis]
MLRRGVLAALALLGLTAASTSVPLAAQPRPALVLAAASLQESMNAAADAWARRGHPRPRLSFAASSALARQAASGAPADLFVSADRDWMDDLQRRGLVVPGTRTDLLGNRPVLIAPRGSSVRVALRPGVDLRPALGPRGRLAMANPDAVPAGKYGKAALEKLGGWQRVAPRVVRGESVRAALALVERGAAPLGIVYATDARASAKVRIAGVFPAGSYPPIVYPAARLRNGTSPDAEPFRRFLNSREGRAIFARFGFSTR